MAIFTAQEGVNFNTMTQLATLVSAYTDFQINVTGTTFYAAGSDTINAAGFGFTPANSTSAPTAGTITSLNVDDFLLFTRDAYTITSLSASVSGLMTAIQNGGSQGGLAYLLSGGDTVYGSGKADVLKGYSGSDAIFGKGGADKIYGGSENDLLMGGGAKDFIDGGAGIDTADYSDKSQSVVATLNGSKAVKVSVGGHVEDTIKNIESLTGGNKADHLTGDSHANTFKGGAGNDNLAGKGGSDSLRGDGGSDTIDGGFGNDHIFGGLGKDMLTGGAGSDRFYFDTALDGIYNVDTIKDFTVGVDKMVLDLSIFHLSNPLDMITGEFFALNSATESDDRIIYNKASGKVFYDADGSGSTYGSILFAQVAKHTDLHASDFAFVA